MVGRLMGSTRIRLDDLNINRNSRLVYFGFVGNQLDNLNPVITNHPPTWLNVASEAPGTLYLLQDARFEPIVIEATPHAGDRPQIAATHRVDFAIQNCFDFPQRIRRFRKYTRDVGMSVWLHLGIKKKNGQRQPDGTAIHYVLDRRSHVSRPFWYSMRNSRDECSATVRELLCAWLRDRLRDGGLEAVRQTNRDAGGLTRTASAPFLSRRNGESGTSKS